MKIYEYFINLDERGEFYADIRLNDNTVYEIKGCDLIDDGFLKHKKDLEGLKEYLTDLKIMEKTDILINGN